MQKVPYTSLAINETLRMEDNAKRLKDVGVDYVETSLDGATREVHENFWRVSGCFEKTMEGIHNYVGENLDVCIAATTQKENSKEI